MVWATGSIPPEVQALSDMLAAVPAFTTWAIGGTHYPNNSLGTDHGVVPDALPNAVIAPDESTMQVYAAGAGALPGGRLTLVLYADTDAAALEQQARLIAKGVCALYFGLANLRATVGLASGPTPGQRAAAAGGATSCQYRTIEIAFSFGLRPP